MNIADTWVASGTSPPLPKEPAKTLFESEQKRLTVVHCVNIIMAALPLSLLSEDQEATR